MVATVTNLSMRRKLSNSSFCDDDVSILCDNIQHDESNILAAERRSAIQRSLNDRGGGTRAATDKNTLRAAMNAFKEERHNRVKKQKRRVGRELSSDSYRRMVARFDEVFSVYLREFMIQLGGDAESLHHTQHTNLCIRLDYNGFLTSSIVIDKL